jgi:hypothetical protein
MRHLQILAGTRARAHIAQHGLGPRDILAVPAAAGGPKGLVLHALDRFLFGNWFARSSNELHLVGASVGAWRMVCAASADPVAALQRMARLYIDEEYAPPPGKRQSAHNIGVRYSDLVRRILDGHCAQVLAHPSRRLHVLADRGRLLLRREVPLVSHIGFALMAACNLFDRRLIGPWIERMVFSDPRASLPLPLDDLPTRHATLTIANFDRVVLASSSIPFWFPSIRDLPDAPPGSYWDGGIVDYQLHWNWSRLPRTGNSPSLVLFPHYESRLVPGWLDKSLHGRHRPTGGLDNVILLCPTADWSASLPGAKIPDRSDFMKMHKEPGSRQKAWGEAVSRSVQLAEDFDAWLGRGCPIDEVGTLNPA